MEEKGLVSEKMLHLDLPKTDYKIVCRSCVRSLAIYLKLSTVCGQINTNGQDLVELNHVRVYKENENERQILRKITLSGIVGINYPPTENNEGYNLVELMVCRYCVGPLARYLQFATVCATTEEKITKYREQIESNGQDLVELNRVRKFCYDNEILRKRTLSGNIESNCRPIENIEVFGVKSVPCVVQQKTECLGNDANHLLKHKKDPSPLVYGENSSEMKRGRSHFKNKRKFHKENAKVEMYECEKCQFKTKRKEYLYKHHLVHRENSEVEMYECGTCEFKTKRKHSLKVHRLVHRANSEVETYECDTCGFKTKYRWYLKNHLLVHRDNSEVEMYECEKCSFKTKHKVSLKNHGLIHRENSEVEMYECEKCSFKTKRKHTLKNHFLVHREISEVEMCKCDKCDFKTKRKHSLNSHRLVHREISKVEMYECDTCRFKTKCKDSLNSHLLIHRLAHRENSEVEMYECETCHSKIKRKSSLSVHKKDNEINMYECEMCNFKSRFKRKLKLIISGNQTNFKS